MTTETPTTEEQQTRTGVVCQINLADVFDLNGEAGIACEMRSTDADNDDSPVNVVCAFIALNWTQIVQDAQAWAKATRDDMLRQSEVEEATIIEPQPKILGTSERSIILPE